ncbi:MAG: Gfo/Idh/MocA family oxidoreductase [Phycisphaerales bacterium]|nr:Gfo/Idh/MocA family oxidoreductase [Phycisphaerales bacterium]
MSNPTPSSSRFSEATRRQFLQAAAATAALGALAGSAAASSRSIRYENRQPAGKAKPRTPLKDGETIRMGVIGVGGMGQGHCAAFPNLSRNRGANVEVIAIADPWPRNLNSAYKNLTEKWQKGVDVQAYADYRQMLERPDLHAVLIASPEHWHHQQAIDALMAGKDVYCEKPMTLGFEAAVAMHNAANANPELICQIGTQKMALPSYLKATEMIKKGLIGQPTCGQTSYCRNTPKGEWNYYQVDPNWKAGKDVDWEAWCGPAGETAFDPYILNRWRRYRKFSTGIIGDLLVHVMTPMMMAANQGWPIRVTASGAHIIDKQMENHDTVNLLVEFETGFQMVVMGATNNDTGLTPLIRGPKGNIEVNDGSVRFIPQKPYAEEAEEQRPKIENIGDDQDQHRFNWLSCIRDRSHPPSDTAMGLKVVTICALATRSLWEGGTWHFDPKTLVATKG